MDAGIKVSCLDAKVNATSRMTFINQAGIVEVGQALMDAARIFGRYPIDVDLLNADL